MKIGFFELPAHLRVGGLEGACRGLEQALRRAGHEVVSFAGPEGARAEIDVAHFHGLWSFAHWRAAKDLRKRGVPYLSSPHGMLEPWAWRAKRWKKLPYFHLLEGPKMRAGGYVLATAHQEAERLARFFPEAMIRSVALGSDFSRTPNYGSARRARGWEEAGRVLLYLSRIHPKKGLRELLMALDGLSADQLAAAPVRLVIVGDGPAAYLESCGHLAQRLAGRVEIEWVGPVWGDEKWSYLQGADLFTLPTYSENFGMVVLEACEVGTPVLTTNETPWQPVANAGFGWVIPPEVSAIQAALGDFLARPIASPDQRTACAEWARAHFSWSVLVAQYLELYASLLRR